jgi:hypothetical protein
MTTTPGEVVGANRAHEVLCVFDIDGVLVHRNAARSIDDRKADYRAGFKYAYHRPFLNTLLKFIKENQGSIRVAFWTASEKHNAMKLIDGLNLKAMNINPMFIWSREECDTLPGPGYKAVKPVQKIYQAYPQYNPQNLIMFDDSPLKLNRIPNGVLVDTYIPSKEIDAADSELLKIIDIIRLKMK